MRNILIVDDEKFIRWGLKKIIERENLPIKNIYESKNGQDAIERLEKDDIDILITDIRMPKMDGIELIKKIHNKNKKVKIIILSGYDEFNYAQEALKYGAKAYILKPVDKNELIDLLKQIENEIKEEEKLKKQEENINKFIKQFYNNELNYIFLNDYITKEEIQNIMDTIKIDIFNKTFYVCILSYKYIKNNYVLENNNELKEYVDKYFIKQQINVLCFWNVKKQLVLIVDEKINFDEFITYLNKKINKKFFICVSNLGKEITDIRKLYLQACEIYSHRFILSENINVVYYEQIKNKIKIVNNLENEIIKIRQMLGTQRYEKALNLLDKVFDIEHIENYHIQYYEQIIEYINYYIINYFNNKIPQEMEKLKQKYGEITAINRFNHINEYIKVLKKYLEEINEYLILLKKENKVENEIDMAIEYIQKNYYKDLNMAVVSNYVSLNYSYFSQLFKERTGMNFIDYLKYVRIEKAKEFLNNTDYKIYEVSEKVGYQNPKHFMKVFKSLTGISPSEYRKKIVK
ncbi:response regulator transcription factor [Defluviitalea phaphyphila]|uniref:response regulator transcription factor n=1 Tax=Defluviitalea phaphyphila TaxID=1473580 RepID=UPI000730DB8E|nr:response regulator [Defluviitalea phaphyphila]